MKATFLAAAAPLTKTFTLEDGQLKKTSHPRIMDCSSYEHDFEDIETLHACLLAHAAEGHCFLKGSVKRPLVNESRAGMTDLNEVTRVLLLDLDGLKQITTVDDFMGQVKLQDCDHIVQYSSSMGVVRDRGLSAHVTVLLDKPWHQTMLKQWLINVNLTNYALRANLGLTRTGNALRWALDVSTCQNDKLIYIAPPILGPGVVDTFKDDRIQLVKRAKRFANLESLGPIPSAAANKVAVEAVLNELREKSGLPKRKRITFKTEGQVEYMTRPDQAVVTGVKHERGFVYLNLNGGDSWGYYHPEGNPEFVHNFKGEPIYKTSELAPDYWVDARKEAGKPRIAENGLLYLAFRDFETAVYYNGMWNKETNELTLAVARGPEQLRDFLMQHGQPIGEFIPDWNVIFDPSTLVAVNTEKKTVNLFQPTRYMLMPKDPTAKVPPLTKRILLSLLGDDEECYERLLNNLAVMLQYRTMPGTAWVFHGTERTGKGLFLNKILWPLFGHVTAKRTREFDSPFNDFVKDNLILWVDEAEVLLHKDSGMIVQDFKNYIKEPKISVRRMYMPPKMMKNHLAVFLAANKDEIISVPKDDSRYNVAPFQKNKLFITLEEYDHGIEAGLEEFAKYLMTREADKIKAMVPLNNLAKEQLRYQNTTSIDLVCTAIVDGDFAFLWEQRPQRHLKDGINSIADAVAGRYMKLMKEIVGGKSTLIREEVFDILAWTVGDQSQSPLKFTSTVKHHGIMFTPTSRDGKSVRGIKVEWRISDDLKKEVLT